MRGAIACLLVASTAHADVDQKGVRSGAVMLSLSNNDSDQPGGGSMATNWDLGWMAGAFVTWRRSDTFALQLETVLSNKRLFSETCTSTSMTESSCMETARLSLYYLEIPFFLRLDLLPKATKFHLDGGVEGVVTLGGGQTPTGGEFQRFDDMLPINIGPVIGVGLEVPAGVGKLAFDLRYKRWLLPIADDGEGGDGNTNSSHQLNLSVGYAFP